MLRLPIVATHERSLETCVYCPKLCRAACPVSNAEASETVTPWGKMSMTYFAGRGDVPVDVEHASTAWACTGCHACREKCDHRNEPATVLVDARADFFTRGAAPPAAVASAAKATVREAEASRVFDELEASMSRDKPPVAGVLVGCGYARLERGAAKDALALSEQLARGPVRAIRSCCGLSSLYAGDREGFLAAATRFAVEAASFPRIILVDPGCARTVLVEYPRFGITIPKPTELLLDLAYEARNRFASSSQLAKGPVRWHAPCQLGRGLGRHDEPRILLEKILGSSPARFLRDGVHSECSGGGGLLPITRPATSAAIADERIAEHRARGGGLLVTACASSLHRFRTRGEPAEDLVSLLLRAITG
ncbi:MAG: (Fe-S)-binding protein [Polyangiaceae bacterium]|nr:(Fe-S)-binding protein [Polyangiaceae bacterium]